MTKDEAVVYLDSLGLLPYGISIIVGTGNAWSNKGGIIVFPGLKTRSNVYTPLLADRSNLESVRKNYLVGRFHGSEIQATAITKSKLKSLHRTFRNGISKKNKDFEVILAFIKTEIKFNYLEVLININHINFLISTEGSKLSYNYSAYLLYSVVKGKFEIRELGPNKYIPIGKHFIQFQKDLYSKQSEESKELIKLLKEVNYE